MKLISTLIAIAFTATACNSDRVFEQNQKLNDNILLKETKMSFEFKGDAKQACNIGINFRYATFYPFKNIKLGFVITDAKNNAVSKDIDFVVRDNEGNGKGDAAGDIWDLKIPVCIDTTLANETYRVEIKSNMPLEKIPGVMELGLSVTRSKK